MEAKYKTLNLKRASIRGRVTKFNNHLEELKGKKLTPTEVSVLSQRLVKLETLFGEFDSVQNQIEALEENNLSLELDTREVIEQAFHNSIALAQEIISIYWSTAGLKKMISTYIFKWFDGDQLSNFENELVADLPEIIPSDDENVDYDGIDAPDDEPEGYNSDSQE
ncbi:unnamed protein product [Parnassius mnemosyne]|uniref:Uncharacterized protein n=1 Tax=Parnassius mnemosyne TaxID=213953 RepID=A0AAV1LH16_9NEOP